MDHIRHLSARPQVLVDNHGRSIGEKDQASRIGREGPFGRERVLFALPIGGTGPVRLAMPVVLKDADGAMIADADPQVIGKDGVLVSRFLTARWVEDTRRLGG